MHRQILVPVDRSSQSTRALDYALQEYPDAALTVLHVIDVNQIGMYGDEAYRFSEEYIQQRRDRAEDVLERARQTAADHGVEIDTELEAGRPARIITEYVADNNIDHIAMGSHGRSGVSRLLLGSVAETVIRRSPVPVTIVR